jgi:hypothetical protein
MEAPFGHAGERLHEWRFATRWWHEMVVPIVLGRGVRLWDGMEGLEKDYAIQATSSPSEVTHVMFTRAGV